MIQILGCYNSTSCLIIHMICTSRSRARAGVMIHRSFGFAYILACRFVGSKSQGIWVVSLYTGMVVGCSGTFGYDGIPRLRGRLQVVTALPVPCNPPCLGIRVGVHKVSMACWQTSARGSPHPSHT